MDNKQEKNSEEMIFSCPQNTIKIIYPVTAALVVLACCATFVQTAPLPQDDLLQDAWWYNTCDSLTEQQHNTTKRHAHKNSCTKLGDNVDKETKRLIMTQMNIFMGNFDKYLENINNSYVKVLSGFTKYTQPAFDFLPKFHKPQKRSKVLLYNFHEDLQKYVVAVHHLLTVHLTSNADMRGEWKTRKDLLRNITNNMKRLLCEVETAVNNTCQAVPPRIPATYARDQGLQREIDSVTELRLLDWGILKRFHTYMQKSKRSLRKNLPQHKESDDLDDVDRDSDEAASLSNSLQ